MGKSETGWEIFKTFQLVQESGVQFEHSFPCLPPGLAYSPCFCGAGFMVLSPARGHCVRMMCVLARPEHFHPLWWWWWRRTGWKERHGEERGNTWATRTNRDAECNISPYCSCLWWKDVLTGTGCSKSLISSVIVFFVVRFVEFRSNKCKNAEAGFNKTSAPFWILQNCNYYHVIYC